MGSFDYLAMRVWVIVCFISSKCLSVNALKLSPLESILLKSRLLTIQYSIREEFESSFTQKEQKFNTFIFPGAGGVDELILELQSVMPNSRIIDWTKYRGNIFTAAFDGEAVGEAIADLIMVAGTNHKDEVHYVGVSVGAFCANAAATKTFLRGHDDDDGENVHLTLLDPFCSRGVFGLNYGRENFGKYATTAIQILNTDDPVPTTNEPLPHCCCIDVTEAPERENFVPLPGDSMHSWPVAYFARHYKEPPSPTERGSILRIPRLKCTLNSQWP